MRLLKELRRAKYNLYVGDIRVKDWESFLGCAYWLTELGSRRVILTLRRLQT
jgi:hypothetical protein